MPTARRTSRSKSRRGARARTLANVRHLCAHARGRGPEHGLRLRFPSFRHPKKERSTGASLRGRSGKSGRKKENPLTKSAILQEVTQAGGDGISRKQVDACRDGEARQHPRYHSFRGCNVERARTTVEGSRAPSRVVLVGSSSGAMARRPVLELHTWEDAASSHAPACG